MEKRPWIFCEYALILEEFDGSTASSTMLPHTLYLEEADSQGGGVEMVKMREIAIADGDFHRVRVHLEAIKNPLVRFVSFKPEGRENDFPSGAV